MPFNGSGSFAPPGANYPAVSNTLITAANRNAVDADFASGLSSVITKDGQTTVTANIPLNGNKLTGVGAATARTDAATLATIQDGTGVYVGTVGGTADAITLTPSPAISAYAAGQTFRWIASGANTGAVTVAINGLAAQAITKNGTTALVAGDIPSGAVIVINYDGTRFQLVGYMPTGVFLPLAGGTMTGTLNVPDNLMRVVGSADATKKLAFEVDGFTTATTRTATPPDYDHRVMSQTKGSDIASAGTVNLDTATGDLVDVTGTTTITAITLTEGKQATVRFTGALTLTNGASLVLPGAANITTVAGDVAVFRGYAAGVVRCISYMPITLPPTSLILGTTQASTSGTSIDFTSLPTWLKRVTVNLSGVSTNGTSGILVQIGRSGGIENTGYTSASVGLATGAVGTLTTSTAGFLLTSGFVAANALHGNIVITLLDAATNLWTGAGTPYVTSGNLYVSSGTKALAGVLDRVRITTVGGADTFDAGSINILYE